MITNHRGWPRPTLISTFPQTPPSPPPEYEMWILVLVDGIDVGGSVGEITNQSVPVQPRWTCELLLLTILTGQEHTSKVAALCQVSKNFATHIAKYFIWKIWGAPQIHNLSHWDSVWESGSLGVRESWSSGVLELGSPGVRESQSPGVLESQSLGVSESWSPGVLNHEL